LAVSDRFVGQVEELGAAAAHLDGNVPQGGTAKGQAGRLAVLWTTEIFHFARRELLKLLHRHL